MQLIAVGKQVLDLLQYNESLISGQLKGFSVYLQDDRLFLDIDVKLMYSMNFNNLTLRFVDVLEYSFNYDIKNHFYNIEEYKLLITNESAYISLDPVTSLMLEINESDNDFVKSKTLHVYG